MREVLLFAALLLALRVAGLLAIAGGGEEEECENPVLLAAKLPPCTPSLRASDGRLVGCLSPDEYARAHGYVHVGAVRGLEAENIHKFRVSCASDAADHASRARETVAHLRRVRQRLIALDETAAGDYVYEAEWEDVQHRREFEHRSHSEGETQPWQLVRGRVPEAWRIGNGGGSRDVVVAVVDDGLARLHPALQHAVVRSLSYNYNHGGNRADLTDCTPLPGSPHGTSAAGVVAAARNSSCGRGVAWGVGIAGIRAIDETLPDATEAEALGHASEAVAVYSCSWGPFDDGKQVAGPGRLAKMAMASAAHSGYGGLGSIYVWAGGNGKKRGDNCAYDGYVCSPYVLAVGAVTQQNVSAVYSEACECIFACAPSSGDGGGIVAPSPVWNAQRDNGCNNDFGGTSAAAPFVAGVVALMRSARPDLTWRDVLDIIARTAAPVGRGWTTNAAGYRRSTACGFGMIDAAAAVGLAKTYGSSGAERVLAAAAGEQCATVILNGKQAEVLEGSQRTLPCVVPDARGTSAVASWARVEDDVEIEHVALTLTVHHKRRGEVAYALISPSGTVARVERRPPDAGADLDGWSFGFRTFRGEHARGRWTLLVVDEVPGNGVAAELDAWTLTARGRALSS